MSDIVSYDVVREMIFIIRGQKVMIDHDLARLYGVTPKRLKEQVRRNMDRFPEDFMFQLSKQEKDEVAANCDHLGLLKYAPSSPYVFTEQGVAMLSSVLNSSKAVQVNIQIMRAFVKLRELISSHKELREKIEAMEKKYDKQFQIVFKALKALLKEPEPDKGNPIGFHAGRKP